VGRRIRAGDFRGNYEPCPTEAISAPPVARLGELLGWVQGPRCLSAAKAPAGSGRPGCWGLWSAVVLVLDRAGVGV